MAHVPEHTWFIDVVALLPIADDDGATVVPTAALVVADSGALVGMSATLASEAGTTAIEQAICSSLAQPYEGAPEGAPRGVIVADEAARAAAARALPEHVPVEIGDVSCVQRTAQDLNRHLMVSLARPAK